MNKTCTLFFLIITLWSSALLAGPGDAVQVIQLKGRTADEMMPLVKPLLKPGDALSGTGYQLIVRTDPATLRDVRAVLDQLDHAQRNLIISVRRGKEESTQNQEINAAGTIRLGNNARLSSGNSDGNFNDNGVAVQVKQRTASTQGNDVQKIRVIEGNRAFIRTGQQVPYPESNVSITPGGRVINQSTRFRNIDSGFYVLPRINGNRVTLSIQAGDSNLMSNQNIAVQQTDTVVTGRIGEWIQIGGISEQSRSSSRGIVSARDQQEARALDIYVKVEAE